jgi:hypothetical protein
MLVLVIVVAVTSARSKQTAKPAATTEKMARP